MVLTKEKRSEIAKNAAKKAWKSRKEKFGKSGTSLSKEEIRKKISEGVKKAFKDGNKELKKYYENQRENPSKSELQRREKIKKAMLKREITWIEKISKTLTGTKNKKGYITSKEVKEKISIGVKKTFKNGNKKLIEYYKKQKMNPSKSELDRRKKISEAMKGRKIPWAHKISKAMMGNKSGEGIIFSEERKKALSKSVKKAMQKKIKEEGFHWGVRKGTKFGPLSKEHKRKLREAKIKYIEKVKLKGRTFGPCIGNNEIEILDSLEKIWGYEIKRQFYIAGYFLDGYIPEIRLAIEVDEDHHKGNKERDTARQKEIEELLGCEFIRINEEKALTEKHYLNQLTLPK